LTHGGNKGIHTAHLEHNTLTAAEGIKQALGICIQFTLVIEINEEMPTGLCKTGIGFFGIVGDEIIN
jgi:hypothetical protein